MNKHVSLVVVISFVLVFFWPCQRAELCASTGLYQPG